MLPPVPAEESVDPQVIRHSRTVGLLGVPLDDQHVSLCLVGWDKTRPRQTELHIRLGGRPGHVTLTRKNSTPPERRSQKSVGAHEQNLRGSR
jgi:hypothetical protein